MKRTAAIASVALFTPVAAFAQASASQGLEGTMAVVSKLVNGLVGLFVVLALLGFFWGIIKYMFGSGPTAKSEGTQFMIYGVITLFVMVSIWGIVNLLQNTFGVRNTPVQIPSGVPQGYNPADNVPNVTR